MKYFRHSLIRKVASYVSAGLASAGLISIVLVSFAFLVISGCKPTKTVDTNSDLKKIGGNIQGVNKFPNGTFAITIDDGPTQGVTDVLVDKVKRHNAANPSRPIKLTFFVVGKRMSSYWQNFFRELTCDENFSIGNHTHTHNLKNLASHKIGTEIRDAHTRLEPLFPDSAVRFFRTPGGSNLSQAERQAANSAVSADYVGSIFWDVGGQNKVSGGSIVAAADWNCWSAGWSTTECLTGYLKESGRKGKGIVLFHDLNRKSADLIYQYAQKMLAKPETDFVLLDEIPSLKAMAADLTPRRCANSTGREVTSPTTPETPTNPVTFFPSSPCTEQLSGLCLTRDSCLDIGASYGNLSSWQTRFGPNTEKLFGNKSLQITSGFCPNDPANVRCCYDPGAVGSGSLSLTLDTSTDAPSVKLSETLQQRRVTESGIPTLENRQQSGLCGLSENDFRTREFFLFSTPKEVSSVCSAKTFTEQVTSGKLSHSAALETATQCFHEKYLLEPSGWGLEGQQSIVDFKLTKIGAIQNSQQAIPAGTTGTLTIAISKENGYIEDGFLSLFLPDPIANATVTSSDIPHSHATNFTFSTVDLDEAKKGAFSSYFAGIQVGAKFHDTCTMRWAGIARELSASSDAQMFYIMPAAKY